MAEPARKSSPWMLALLLLSGCAAEVMDAGETTRIAFTGTTRAWVVGVPAAIVLVGALLATNRQIRAVGLTMALSVGALAALIVPGVLKDEVVVTKESVHQTTGFWFAPTVKGFRFDQVESIRIVDKPDEKGRMQMIWEIHEKDGGVRDLDPGDLWEMSSPAVVERLERRGVRFQ